MLIKRKLTRMKDEDYSEKNEEFNNEIKESKFQYKIMGASSFNSKTISRR